MARDPHGPTRRQALQGLGAATVLSACGKPEPEPGPDDRTLEDLVRDNVDTVVLVMLENRSFDHYLGALSLEEGHPDVDGLTADMSNPLPDGTPVFVFPTQLACLEDPPHSWSASHDQFNEGANDGFVTRYRPNDPVLGPEVMGYWTRDTLPAFYALSDAYVTCDQWFCSVMSSTWPNRFYSLCGQNGGMNGNDLPPAPFPAIFTPLEEAGWTWGDYFSNVPFNLLLPSTSLGSPQFQEIERFFEQAAAGTLPNFTVVEPMYGWNDDHPPNHPLACQIFVATVYEALAQSPQWDRIALVITYDEHGGFFDHVPPPKADDDRTAEGFDQLGFRVPSLVVGPWVKPGHVSHVVYDHTSILALIERIFGLDPLTARDAAADPLLDCFDEERMRAGTPYDPVRLDPIQADESEIYADECVSETPFATREAAAARRPTGQEELEAVIDARWSGTRYDRRPDSLAIYEGLLARAEALGVLNRKPL